MDLYLIPGLGADHRLFGALDLPGHPLHFLDWPAMDEGSTLADFASVLAAKVDMTRPHALIGVSMGGMVAQELAVMTKPKYTIIVSSWKGPQEMPPVIRAMRGMHPERMLTQAFLRRLLPLVRWQMGLATSADATLFDSFIASVSLEQLKVQIAAVLAWEGPPRPVPSLVHLHGDNDLLMPVEHIAGATVVPGGGHFMVHNRGEELSGLVLRALAGG